MNHEALRRIEAIVHDSRVDVYNRIGRIEMVVNEVLVGKINDVAGELRNIEYDALKDALAAIEYVLKSRNRTTLGKLGRIENIVEIAKVATKRKP